MDTVEPADADADDLVALTDGAVLHALGPGAGEADAAAGAPVPGGTMASGDDAREVIRATGADRVRFLNGIVTGSVGTTPVGGGCHATLLTLKAHVVAELRIFLRAEDAYLVVARGQGGPAARALARYAITDDFAAEPLADFGLLALLGPAAERYLAEIGYPVETLADRDTWSHEDRSGPAGPVWLVRAHQLGADGYWLGAPASTLGAVKAALGARGLATLSASAARAARVAAFEPAWGHEITGEHFPMEVGLGDAIDYQKGCFLGQEPIVRIRDRGHVNWRLAQVRVVGTSASDRLPSPAWQIEAVAKARAGALTSVARVRGQGVLALGLLHASVPVGAPITLVGPEGMRLEATVVRD
jgi:folate-binding protein YgfZ